MPSDGIPLAAGEVGRHPLKLTSSKVVVVVVVSSKIRFLLLVKSISWSIWQCVVPSTVSSWVLDFYILEKPKLGIGIGGSTG